jgi:hypothetical protein
MRGPGGTARVHRGPRWRLGDVRHAGTRAHRCSLAVVEGDEPDKAVLEGCSSEHERRRNGGEER